jgi:hypothetical protein
MRGGMTMVGDMFNHGLKAKVEGKVEGLCSELSQLLTQEVLCRLFWHSSRHARQ